MAAFGLLVKPRTQLKKSIRGREFALALLNHYGFGGEHQMTEDPVAERYTEAFDARNVKHLDFKLVFGENYSEALQLSIEWAPRRHAQRDSFVGVLHSLNELICIELCRSHGKLGRCKRDQLGSYLSGSNCRLKHEAPEVFDALDEVWLARRENRSIHGRSRRTGKLNSHVTRKQVERLTGKMQLALRRLSTEHGYLDIHR